MKTIFLIGFFLLFFSQVFSWNYIGTNGISQGICQDFDLAYDVSNVLYVVYSDTSNSYKANLKIFTNSNWIMTSQNFTSNYATKFTLFMDTNWFPTFQNPITNTITNTGTTIVYTLFYSNFYFVANSALNITNRYTNITTNYTYNYLYAFSTNIFAKIFSNTNSFSTNYVTNYISNTAFNLLLNFSIATNTNTNMITNTYVNSITTNKYTNTYLVIAYYTLTNVYPSTNIYTNKTITNTFTNINIYTSSTNRYFKPFVSYMDRGKLNKLSVSKFDVPAWNESQRGISPDQIGFYQTFISSTIYTNTSMQNTAIAPVLTNLSTNVITLITNNYTNVSTNIVTNVITLITNNYTNVSTNIVTNTFIGKYTNIYTNQGIFDRYTAYALFTDKSKNYKASMMKYTNAGSWFYLGQTNFSSNSAAFTSFTFDTNGDIYSAFQDTGLTFKGRLMRYTNGGSWFESARTSNKIANVVVKGHSGAIFMVYSDMTSGKLAISKFINGGSLTFMSSNISAGFCESVNMEIWTNGNITLAYSDVSTNRYLTVLRWTNNNYTNGSWITLTRGNIGPAYNVKMILNKTNGNPIVGYSDYQYSTGGKLSIIEVK